MKWRILLVSAVLLVAGCGEIKHSARLAQTLDQPLAAGVGDAIVQIDTQESLPNIVGKADIFGRTRPTGRIVVVYLGLEQGRAVFERQTIRIQSNATTMNSSPTIIPQYSTTTYSGTGSVYGRVPGGTFSGTGLSSGTATTTGPPIIIPPSGSETKVISNDRIRYYMDLTEGRKLIVEGHEIQIDEATASAISYRVIKLI